MKPWTQLSISLGALTFIVLVIVFSAKEHHDSQPIQNAPTVLTPDCKKLMRTSKQLGPEPKPELGILFYQDIRNQPWELCMGLGIRYRTDI